MSQETEKLKIEIKKLEEEKNRFESLFNESPHGYFTFDINCFITEANRSACKKLCLEKEDIINKIFHVFVVKEYWETFNLFFQNVFVNEKKQSCELKLIDKNGRTFWAHLQSIMVLNSFNGNLQCRTSVTDISERKESEIILERKQNDLNAAQRISNLGNWIWDVHLNKISWSDHLYEIFELKKQEFEITPKYFFSRVSSTTKREILFLIDRSISNKKSLELDFLIINSQKKDKIVNFKCKPAYDQKDNLLSLHGTIQDITEIKKQSLLLEEKTIELNKLNGQLVHSKEKLKLLNENKDKFCMIISHNLKNPFSTLLNLTETLSSDLCNLENDDVKIFADKINDSSKRIYALLENLLAWSKIQFSKSECLPEVFNIFSVTENNLKLLEGKANSKNIQVKTKINKKSTAYTDRNIFDAVLQNLFINAVKFSHNGGVIIIETENKDDFIQISVSDNGVGMSNKTAKNLFKLENIQSTLGTENEKGTGLGLLICKDLIERQGGKIDVESYAGKGSKFMFTVPLYKEGYNKNLSN